ncbi:MAG: Cys-tRNA(Pro) deacylase [Aeromicrobium sp.]|uniref:Cys-tRNA(Pro) deacylase n=1 Tax=Aeromicrobium sp. TaxID=1871063 RepID=UPI0039E62F47
MSKGESTPAVAALLTAGVDHVLHPYTHDPRVASYGREAAEALDVDPDRVFKTLMIDLGGTLAVAVVPVSCTLDLKAAAGALGAKRATMADPVAAQRATGYVLGGISPLGQRRGHRTVIDETVELWDTVLVSGGRRGLDVELSAADLIDLTEGIVAAIAR